jgi:hypothetical protein
MSTESLADMTIPELRVELAMAVQQLTNIGGSLRGTRGAERREIEEALKEAREYVRIIKARIARLERRERNAI